MRKLITFIAAIFILGTLNAQIPFWGSFYQMSTDRTDTLWFEATDSGFVVSADTAVYFLSKGDTGRFIFDTIHFLNGEKLYGANYTDSLSLYWDSTEVPIKVASQVNDSSDILRSEWRSDINDSLSRIEDSLSVHVDTLQAHRTDINTKITATDAGSQIHDSLNNIHCIVFDTTDLGTKSDTFTIDLSKQINYVTIDDTVAINYSNAQSTTYLFIIEISGNNAKINWGTGWQAAGGSVSLTETDGVKILISAFYDIRNNKMIITEVDDVQDL